MTFVQIRVLCLIKHRYLNSKEGVSESTFHHCLTLMARMKTDKWDSRSLPYWLRMLARCMWDLGFDLCSLGYLCLVAFNGLGEKQTKRKTRPDCEKRPLTCAQQKAPLETTKHHRCLAELLKGCLTPRKVAQLLRCLLCCMDSSFWRWRFTSEPLKGCQGIWKTFSLTYR